MKQSIGTYALGSIKEVYFAKHIYRIVSWENFQFTDWIFN